jgi:hypothetical protein
MDHRVAERRRRRRSTACAGRDEHSYLFVGVLGEPVLTD